MRLLKRLCQSTLMEDLASFLAAAGLILLIIYAAPILEALASRSVPV